MFLIFQVHPNENPKFISTVFRNFSSQNLVVTFHVTLTKVVPAENWKITLQSKTVGSKNSNYKDCNLPRNVRHYITVPTAVHTKVFRKRVATKVVMWFGMHLQTQYKRRDFAWRNKVDGLWVLWKSQVDKAEKRRLWERFKKKFQKYEQTTSAVRFER